MVLSWNFCFGIFLLEITKNIVLSYMVELKKYCGMVRFEKQNGLAGFSKIMKLVL